MKTLDFKQMEQVEGGDGCTSAGMSFGLAIVGIVATGLTGGIFGITLAVMGGMLAAEGMTACA